MAASAKVGELFWELRLKSAGVVKEARDAGKAAADAAAKSSEEEMKARESAYKQHGFLKEDEGPKSLSQRARANMLEARQSGEMALSRAMSNPSSAMTMLGAGIGGLAVEKGAEAFERITEKAVEIHKESLETGKNWADMGGDMMAQVPVIGSIVNGAKNIEESVTHRKEQEEIVTEQLKAQSEYMEKQVEFSNRIREATTQYAASIIRSNAAREALSTSDESERVGIKAEAERKADEMQTEEAIRTQREALQKQNNDELAAKDKELEEFRKDYKSQYGKDPGDVGDNQYLQKLAGRAELVKRNADKMAGVEADARKALDARNEASVMQQADEEMKIARRLSDDHYRMDTELAAKSAEAQGRTLDAEKLRITASYEERIVQARRNNDMIGEEQLRALEKVDLRAAQRKGSKVSLQGIRDAWSSIQSAAFSAGNGDPAAQTAQGVQDVGRKLDAQNSMTEVAVETLGRILTAVRNPKAVVA